MPAKIVEALIEQCQMLDNSGKQKRISEFMAQYNGKMPIVELGENGEAEVTFLYLGEKSTENVSVLAGFSGYHLGDSNRMARVSDTNLFIKSYTLSPGAKGFTYQFALNLTDEQLKIGANSVQLNYQHGTFNDDLFSDVNNRRQYQSGDARFSYFEVTPAEYQEQLMQHINESRREDWQHLPIDESRGYRVLLPQNFKRDEAKKYPVYLFADGDHSFNLLNPYAALKALGQEEAIIVLLDTQTKNRVSDYLFNVNQYIEMIINKVIPILKENYNASTEACDYYGVGSSLGAHLMLRLAIVHPEILGNVLSQSANIGYVDDEHDLRLMNELKKLDARQLEALKKVCIRVTVGTYENVCYSDGDNILLANRKFKTAAEQAGLSFSYAEAPAAHDYIPTWRNNLPQDLKLLLDQRIRMDLKSQGKSQKQPRVEKLVNQYQAYIDRNKKELHQQQSENKQEPKPTALSETRTAIKKRD